MARTRRRENSATTRHVTVLIPSAPEYLKVIRAVIREFGELDHWSDEDIRATVLAVDEACSNIMKHAYKGQTGHTITVKIEAGEEALQVELLDQGEPVDPNNIQPRKLDEIRPGGLGVYLISALMDDVVFDTEYTEGNRLILKRRITRTDGREA